VKNMRKRLLWILFTIPLILSVITMEANAQESDIAVISVTPSKNQVKVGDFVNITVVVENEGNVAVTFNVTVYYDSSTIRTETNVALSAGANRSLSFSWNTTGVGEEVYAATEKQKLYNLTATASTVPGETDTADNTLVSDSTVMVMSQYVAIVPDTILDPTLTVGKNFTISICTDYNGSDVWGYQFTLIYNPLVLQGVNATNGDLITNDTFAHLPPFMWPARFKSGVVDNTGGPLSLPVAFFYFTPPDDPPTTPGPGTLANVTFTVIGIGDSNITLGKETQLKSPTSNIVDKPTYYPSHLLNCYFRNLEEAPIHDVAVISVTPSPTSAIEGELVNITVVVGNEGNVPETFSVKTEYLRVGAHEETAKLISETNVQNLAANAQRTLTFSWNTKAVLFGNHTIIATAILSSDINTANNRLGSDEAVAVRAYIVPFPIEMMLGVVVVVGGIIAALAIYNARRKKK